MISRSRIIDTILRSGRPSLYRRKKSPLGGNKRARGIRNRGGVTRLPGSGVAFLSSRGHLGPIQRRAYARPDLDHAPSRVHALGELLQCNLLRRRQALMARTAFGAAALARRLGVAQPESREFRCIPVHGASLRSASFTAPCPFAMLAMQLSCLPIVAQRNQSLTS